MKISQPLLLGRFNDSHLAPGNIGDNCEALVRVGGLDPGPNTVTAALAGTLYSNGALVVEASAQWHQVKLGTVISWFDGLAGPPVELIGADPTASRREFVSGVSPEAVLKAADFGVRVSRARVNTRLRMLQNACQGMRPTIFLQFASADIDAYDLMQLHRQVVSEQQVTTCDDPKSQHIVDAASYMLLAALLHPAAAELIQQASDAMLSQN